MTNPLSLQFWREEERRLWADLEPLAQAALLAGVEGAVRALPVELEQLVNFDFVNRAALRYLQQYRLDTVSGINATTRERTVSAIREWMGGDEGIDALKRELRPLFGKTRADAVATTEVTRVFGVGNQTLWQSTGVVRAKRWRTAVDDRVCEICAPLEGRVVEISSSFSHTPDELQNEALQQALTHLDPTFQTPPAHPRCRCWLQPVVSEQLLRREIGDILAQEFFAKVAAGQYDVYVAQVKE